jgi:hypothetical protein
MISQLSSKATEIIYLISSGLIIHSLIDTANTIMCNSATQFYYIDKSDVISFLGIFGMIIVALIPFTILFAINAFTKKRLEYNVDQNHMKFAIGITVLLLSINSIIGVPSYIWGIISSIGMIDRYGPNVFISLYLMVVSLLFIIIRLFVSYRYIKISGVCADKQNLK